MRKLIISIIVFLILFILFITGYYCYKNFYVASIPLNINVTLNDNTVNIDYVIKDKSRRNKIYYIINKNKKKPSINDKNWALTKNNKISYNLDKNIYYVYLKNEDNKIFEVNSTDKLGKIVYFVTSKDELYLSINDTYSPTLVYEGVGYIDDTISWSSSNEKAAKVSDNGVITAVGNGESIITAKIMNNKVNINVTSSNLIVKKPKRYDYNKPYLGCGMYTKKENDLLDKILKYRIEEAGYGTRAGAVEAARFLSLEFPYRINYFSENGRVYMNGVDSEGRYYHKGLYLHESRFKDIGKKRNGPATWGCMMYSGPAHGQRRNGLDCSGFVSWVLYNGGFDVKDVGAGLASGLDLTDYGKRTVFTKDLVDNKKVKVGDLLSSGGVEGGHIAIIIGEDEINYYVAESLWTKPNVGVVVTVYPRNKIYKEFYYVMLMDNYYKNDGNLTKLWY